MATLIELDPQDIIANLETIDWVERNGSKVEYYGGSQKHEIQYGNDAAAEAAVDDWFALQPPPPALDIEVGDQVKMAFSSGAGGSHVRTIEVEVVAVPRPPVREYWLVKDANTLFAVHEPVTISKPL